MQRRIVKSQSRQEQVNSLNEENQHQSDKIDLR